MLKRSYGTLAEIPAAYRADYVEKDGRFVVDVEGFEYVEKVLEKNQELITRQKSDSAEITSLKGQLTKANNDRAEMVGKSIPDGHVAIPVAEKQLLDSVRKLGDPQEIEKKLGEYPTLKANDERRTREERAARLAELQGWDSVATRALVDKLPADWEEGDLVQNGQIVKDDKGATRKTAIVKVEDDKGVTTVKSMSDYLSGSPELKDLLPLLTAKTQQQGGGTELPPMGYGGGGGDLDLSASLIKDRYEDPPVAAGAGA